MNGIEWRMMPDNELMVSLCCFFVVILEICLVMVWNIFVERVFEKEMEKMTKNADFL